jgi:hypothetical protein
MLKIESDKGKVRLELDGPVEEVMANLNMACIGVLMEIAKDAKVDTSQLVSAFAENLTSEDNMHYVEVERKAK